MSEMKKIVWAVDPIAEDMALQNRCAQMLKIMGKGGVTIEPVYVLSPDQLRLSSSLFPVKLGELRLEAESRLAGYLKKVKVPGVSSATVLVSNDLSLRSAVHALVEYARQSDANLIVVSTLARKGVKRFLLGSFAETIIMQSEIPVIVVSPTAKVATKITEVLVPTDLGDRSKEVLAQIAAFAKQMKARVVLFHQVEYLTQFTIDQFGAVPAYQKFIDEDVKRREQTAQSWCSELAGAGVRAEFVLRKKGAFASDSILREAGKRKSTLIAMASQTGPVSTALLGSVTRQVIRGAKCPVWVIHPSGYRVSEKKNTSESSARKGTVLL